MFQLLLAPLRHFRRSERGSMSVETVMIVPILLFAYAGLFTFFDAFRTVNLNTRGSYTIADMLSRESNTIDDDYIAGLNTVLSILTQSDYDTILRVTLVHRVAEDDLRVAWSAVDGGTGNYIKPITDATYTEIEDHVPIMADGDVNIIVQTWSGFVPMMRWVGVEPQYFEHTVATRPRFDPSLCYEQGGEDVCYAF